MKKYVLTTVSAVLTLTVIGVRPAAAQDTGKSGLVMMSGSSIGVTIQATDSVAIRPSLGFSRSTSESAGAADGDRTATGWSPGISLLFKVKTWDATQLYVSPQWTYSRSTSSEDGESEAVTATGHSLAAMLGARHNLGNRFAVFGEVGLARSTAKSSFLDVVGGKSTLWATRSAIGGILFF